MKKTYKSYDSGDNQPPIILIIFVVWIICFIVCYLIFWNKIKHLQSENSKLQRQITETPNKKEITEYIWSWTCVWEWEYQIEWYAKCNTSDWWSYIWDVRWHSLNWKWVLTTPEWDLSDWYFYNWNFVAWKISKSNWDAVKWLRVKKDENTITLDIWKIFRKNSGNIELWDFDISWNLSYWMKYTVIANVWAYRVWEYKQWNIVNWYMIFPNWCWKFANGNATEITRTITNTIYTNNVINTPKNILWEPWSITNPYRVELTVK